MNRTHQRHRPKIAVIGAGWSGLAAAVALCKKADLTLFEAGQTAGGRARALNSSAGGFSFLDNGQHIMLGAYHGVRTLMETVGADWQAGFVRRPLQWHLADGMQFQTGILPAPWHVLAGVLRAKNVSMGDKLALVRQMRALQRHRSGRPDQPVMHWLRRQNASRKLLQDFWQPLVWGALNTPLAEASLNTLANVVQDGVCAGKAAGEYWLPARDLGSLLPQPALAWLKQQGAQIKLGQRVGRLRLLPGKRVEVDGEMFDAVVSAVAPYHAAALWPQETPPDVLAALADYRYHAITTVYLRYATPPVLPALMTGFADGTAQWLFQRGQLGGDPHEIAAVISISEQYRIQDAERWATKVHADVLRVCPKIGEPVASKVITEKRATVAAGYTTKKPDCAWLHQQRIYPAGDYLHPRYPATLEAAVQSGQAAAGLVQTEFNI